MTKLEELEAARNAAWVAYDAWDAKAAWDAAWSWVAARNAYQDELKKTQEDQAQMTKLEELKAAYDAAWDAADAADAACADAHAACVAAGAAFYAAGAYRDELKKTQRGEHR
tara:strand:- start:563 stop:898 length:336 start_codon:yes stop_codon:yes gene_type:complete